jgi:hypothetical protein
LIECRSYEAAALAWSEGLSKNFLVGLLGIGSSSENASLGLLMKPRGKNQSKNQVPVPMVGVKKIKCFFGGAPRCAVAVREEDVSSPQGHDEVSRR